MIQTTIPYLHIDKHDWHKVPALLEEQGRRLHIAEQPWAADFPYAPIAVVDLAYCDEGLLLHYFVRGLDLRTLSPKDGEYVHEDSCVEFFMQRERGEAYINFEFNAASICYACHHPRVGEGTKFTAEEFATIHRSATHEGKRLNIEGLHEWELTAMIPWRTMGYAEREIPQRLWGNLYKCADGTKHPHYLSWAPIEEKQPAFHRPQFFGEFVLGDRK